MAITTKELLLIQDNVKMAQNSIRFMQGCVEVCGDPQVKTMCQQFADEHQKDVSILMKHLNPSAVQ